jgi:hypothetical protein
MTLKVTMYGPGYPEGGKRLAEPVIAASDLQGLLTPGIHEVALEAGGTITYRGGDGSPFSFKVEDERPARVSVARRIR